MNNDTTDVRDHIGAMLLLLSIALGDQFEVKGDDVWVTTPGSDRRAISPVPIEILEAIESRGYILHDDLGSHVTARGLATLRRWGPRAFGKQAWQAVERRLNPPVW